MVDKSSSQDEQNEQDELNKLIKPVINEIYAILLDSKEPFIGEVTDINELDHIVVIKTNAGQEHLFMLKDDILLLQSKESGYKILDIERVIPFDIELLEKDVDQLNKQLTSDIIQELDISLDDIVDKDIVYTDIELREDITSHLIKSFNAYDNYSLIKSINESIYNIFELLDQDEEIYLFNINLDKTLPKWLIPIVDNPLKLYSEEDNTEDLDGIGEQENSNYNQRLIHVLDNYRPVQSSLSDVGYSTNTISSYFRDCLQTETCVGINGNYKYDTRRNKHPYISIYDSNKQLIHSSDYLNVVGFIYIPDDKLLIFNL